MHENFKWNGAGWYASRQEEFDHVQYINTYWVAEFDSDRYEAGRAARQANLGTPHRYAAPPAGTDNRVVWNPSDEHVAQNQRREVIANLFHFDPTYEAAPGLTWEVVVTDASDLNGDDQAVAMQNAKAATTDHSPTGLWVAVWGGTHLCVPVPKALAQQIAEGFKGATIRRPTELEYEIIVNTWLAIRERQDEQ
jgi:hypothetical protein